MEEILAILYADDTVLVNRSPAGLEKATDVFEKISKRWGPQLNRGKTVKVPRHNSATHKDAGPGKQKTYEKQAVCLGSVAAVSTRGGPPP